MILPKRGKISSSGGNNYRAQFKSGRNAALAGNSFLSARNPQVRAGR